LSLHSWFSGFRSPENHPHGLNYSRGLQRLSHQGVLPKVGYKSTGRRTIRLNVAMIWFNSLILPLLLISIASASSLPAFPRLYEKRNPAQLVPRQTSDPCCKSCGPIAKVLADCQTTNTDIFCGCDQWVAAAPGCEACIFNVAFNTSFALNPGPALELFWSWCQCQKACRGPAEAIYGNTCAGGTDAMCVSKALVKYGPTCSCCMKGVDGWFTSFFDVWIEQAKQFIATGKSSVPGTLLPSPLRCSHVLITSCRNVLNLVSKLGMFCCKYVIFFRST
jgi:hypothetical protein